MLVFRGECISKKFPPKKTRDFDDFGPRPLGGESVSIRAVWMSFACKQSERKSANGKVGGLGFESGYP